MTKPETNKWDRREVGALWTKLSKDKSQKYMTGHINTSLEGKIDVVIFSNKDKKNEKAPDFRVYISDKPKKDSAEKQVPASVSKDTSSEEEGVL